MILDERKWYPEGEFSETSSLTDQPEANRGEPPHLRQLPEEARRVVERAQEREEVEAKPGVHRRADPLLARDPLLAAREQREQRAAPRRRTLNLKWKNAIFLASTGVDKPEISSELAHLYILIHTLWCHK